MLDWLRIIGEFLINHVKMAFSFMNFFSRATTTIASTIYLSPSFLTPLLLLMLAVIIIMWVVNLF